MELTLPLYRQLSGRLLLLFFCLVLSAATGVAVYFYQAQQLLTFNSQQLPEIRQYNQRQQLLLNHERLINTITASKTAAEFLTSYQILTDNLKQLSTLSRRNYRLFDRLLQRLQLQARNVDTLTDNYRRNIQLKDSAIIQLTLVTDSLSALISKQEKQQASLYQQASSGNISPKRALVLSNVAINLNNNRELHRLLVNSLVMFSGLDLQYDLIELNYLQQQSHSGLQNWLLTMSHATKKNNAEEVLSAQVAVLNDLLFLEQNIYEKWRLQLSYADDFRIELLAEKIELVPLLIEPSPRIELKKTKLNQYMQAWFSKMNLTVSEAHYTWLVGGGLSALVLLSLMLLFSIRSKLKRFGQQSTAIVGEYIKRGALPRDIPSQEISDIITAIAQVSQSKQSNVDNHCLKQELRSARLLMSEHSGYIFWQLPQPRIEQSLILLLALDATVKHWRSLFSRNDVHKVLAAARIAKKDRKIQRLSLVTRKEKAISLTIAHEDGCWRGSICLAEELHQLQYENSQLLQQLQQQRQGEKLNIIADSDYVANMVHKAVLQRQLLSLEKQTYEPAADVSLARIIKWCQQQKTSAQLRQDDFLLTLTSVNIFNELDTVIANTAIEQYKNNNALYLNIDKALKPLVSLESELFQAMVQEICLLLLAKQRHATLDITCKATDITSTQQIVQCSFLVAGIFQPDAVAQAMNVLLEDTDAKASSGDYLRDLMLVFNVCNKTTQWLDNATQFSFDIPLTVVEQKSVEGTKTKDEDSLQRLAQRHILVVATDKSSRQRIAQALSDTPASVETMQDLTLFQRQLNIEHLTKNSLDAIVIAPEVYRCDYALIMQHLASLPEKLSPKVLVVQPANDPSIARVGVFGHCNLPWFQRNLAAQLAQLLSEKNSNNLLIDSRYFSQYRFLPTQVKVLLAIAQPSAHQSLIQLLQYLGLGITLVSQQQSLTQHWRTGQYLVVISEFMLSRITALNSTECARGIFSLTNGTDSADDFFAPLALPKSWSKGNISPVLDVQAIINLLLPWLRLAEVKDTSDSAVKELPEHLPVTEINTDNCPQVSGHGQSAVDLVTGCPPQDAKTPIFFDLAQYAKNQGSVELAALMLDEYLMDIERALLQLEEKVNANNKVSAEHALMRVLHFAEVIAAKQLSAQCLYIKAALNIEKTSQVCSLQENEYLQEQLMQVKVCYRQLSEFVKSV